MNGRGMLEDRALGCLLGGLIGDAMGAPAEGKTAEQIQAELGWIEDFQGEGTDDSALRRILCDAILSSEGWVTADEFAAAFLRNKQNYYRLFYIPVKNMFHKIESELSLPVYAGLGNMHSSSSAMCISPMGIINACDPRQAAVETFDVAGLIHAGDSGFCRDGACAMAAAVAEAMRPGATRDSVVAAATAYLHKKSGREMTAAIGEALDKARETGDCEAFRAWHYAERLRDIISDSRETVPAALALFWLADGDPRKGIPYGANFGRDADTIATMVGGLCGAFRGTAGLGEDWVRKALANAPEQEKLAEGLAAAVARRLEGRRAILTEVEKLL